MPYHSQRGTRIHGGAFEQVVYAYKPGIRKGWVIEGTEPLILYFSADGLDLQEWHPLACVVQPTRSLPDAGAEAVSSGQLRFGNPRIASTTNHFETLLGSPDDRRIEYEFNYYLGKRWRFAWDEVFLELHFDSNKKLTRIDRSEH